MAPTAIPLSPSKLKSPSNNPSKIKREFVSVASTGFKNGVSDSLSIPMTKVFLSLRDFLIGASNFSISPLLLRGIIIISSVKKVITKRLMHTPFLLNQQLLLFYLLKTLQHPLVVFSLSLWDRNED